MSYKKNGYMGKLQMELTTLCYIETEDAYLMLHRTKKKKDVNKDKWIGIGGHFEAQESPEDCLLREAREETGLHLTDWRFRGIVTFCFEEENQGQGISQPICEYMCLYTATGYEGRIQECNEGELVWVPKKDVLSLNLWEGDRIFFDLLIREVPFFSLKLSYKGERLEQAVLNGKELELLDVLDETGQKNGQTRERSLVHAYGTWHATSHVWIIQKRADGGMNVLLQKRSSNKDSFPGCWDISSAGHIPAGSDFRESAVRELKEELGLTVQPEKLRLLDYIRLEKDLQFYGKPFLDRQISAVFVYEWDGEPDELKLQESEIEAVRFEDYDKCMEELQRGNKEYCIFQQEFAMLKACF